MNSTKIVVSVLLIVAVAVAKIGNFLTIRETDADKTAVNNEHALPLQDDDENLLVFVQVFSFFPT